MQAALGLGAELRNRDRPVQVPTASEIKGALRRHGVVSVVAGGANSAVVRGGALVSWGANKVGQLAHGDTARRPAPRLVKPRAALAAASLVSVSLGASHALALLESRVSGALAAKAGGGRHGRVHDDETEARLRWLCGSGGVGPTRLMGQARSWGPDSSMVKVAAAAEAAATGRRAGGGGQRPQSHKQSYSAGGGSNKREIRTPKSKTKSRRAATPLSSSPATNAAAAAAAALVDSPPGRQDRPWREESESGVRGQGRDAGGKGARQGRKGARCRAAVDVLGEGCDGVDANDLGAVEWAAEAAW